MPLSSEQTAPDNASYVEGIHCTYCVDSLTAKKRASLEERQKQIQLAAAKHSSHLGLQLSEIKAMRTEKRNLKRKLASTQGGTADAGTGSGSNADSLIVVTRVHCKSSTALVDIKTILSFAQKCVVYADKVLILLGITMGCPDHHLYLESLMEALHGEEREVAEKVQVEVVTPWVGFTAPLNVGIRLALDAGYDYVLFQVSYQSMCVDVRNMCVLVPCALLCV